MTRIGVPTAARGGLDDVVGEHFGRVPTYTLFDSETRQVNVVANTSEHLGGQGLPADILADLEIEVLLCRDAGRRALRILADHDIEVFLGVTGTVGDAIAAWEGRTLSRASEADACQQHAFHDREKHEE